MYCEPMHLETLLRNSALKPSLVTPAMTLLEPLYYYAGQRTYGLSPRSEVLVEKAMKAVACATGETATKIITIPVDHPFEMPDWLTRDTARKMLERAFQEMTGGPRSRWMLGARIEARRPTAVDHAILKQLESRLGMSLWDGLETGLDRYFSNQIGKISCGLVSYCMRHTVLWYLAHVIAGQDAHAQAIAPVIALYPKIIPLCEHQERRGVWIALVNS